MPLEKEGESDIWIKALKNTRFFFEFFWSLKNTWFYKTLFTFLPKTAPTKKVGERHMTRLIPFVTLVHNLNGNQRTKQKKKSQFVMPLLK